MLHPFTYVAHSQPTPLTEAFLWAECLACLCRRVSLLTVIGLWTLLSVKLLVLAQRLERSVADVIHALNQHLVSTHSLTH